MLGDWLWAIGCDHENYHPSNQNVSEIERDVSKTPKTTYKRKSEK